ncbi:PAS domain S-box protein [Sphingomonas sp. ABOLE]|uniref:PAS domain S-box protein n=1 Tax=Sphingomonas sp. ABOLE TaxID=1985878 RepID=UPI000F7EDE44|nr:PAS domain S-box protein [Sphingomonas sp. ABOLE]RSV35853.1 PAS domain S-box protein [Sphingomonas sp. ABOLE]
MDDLEELMRRQQALAEFGDFVLDHEDLDQILTEGCRLIAQALGTDLAKVMEIEHDAETAFVRAGIGWRAGVVGAARVRLDDRSSEAFAIAQAGPVITNDIVDEARFVFPPFLRDHGVCALVNVPILLPGRRPWGLLQVDAREPRAFDDRSIQFLKTYAMVLGPVIDRLRVAAEREQALMGVREREERLQLVTDAMPGLIAYIDKTFCYRFANRRYEEWFGLPTGTILGRHLREVLGEAAFDRLLPHAEVALSGKRHRFEAEVAFKLGGTRHVQSEFVPDIREDGSVAGYYSLVLDATPRHEAELALRESETLRGLALESGGMGAWRWDTRAHTVHADAVVQKLWGVFATQQPHAVALYAGMMDAEGLAWLESGTAEQVIPGESFGTRMQVSHGRNAGRWVQLRGKADLERPWIINGVTFDVTEQVVAEQELARYRTALEQQVRQRTAELQASRDLLQATMDASTDLIQVFEAERDATGAIVDFRWVLINPEAERRFGPVIGERLVERNPGVQVEGIFDAFRRVTETGISERAERHYVHEQFDGWFYQSAVKLGDGVATTTTDISEWKAAQADLLRLRDQVAQAQLRASEERFRLLVQSVRDYAIFTMDRAGRITSWPAGAVAVYGWSEEEMIGQSVDRTFVPEDVADGAPEWERAVAACDGVAPNVRWHLHKGGTRIFIDGSTQPLFGADGEIREFIKIGQDVTEARRVQQALSASEERLRAAVDVGRLGLWDWNVASGEVHWSDEHFRMEGYAVGEVTPSYEAWASRVHPEDRAETEAALQDAREQKQEFTREFRAVHPDGSVHWLSGRGRFFYDEQGNAVRMIGAMVDTTERREWEERQQVLIAELQHRTRNLMGVVRSMADKTARASGDFDQFRGRFGDRLEALARVQGLLSRLNEHDRVTFDELIETELAAMGGNRDGIRLEGPKGVRLRSSTVQTLALALHELATNAVKYGALGQAGGCLTVTWRMAQDAASGRPWLHIDWRETGVDMPPPASGARGGGQGRELIERALPYQLGARTSYTLGADGVHCTILMPVSSKPARES